MNVSRLNVVAPMLFVKFSILVTIIISLTLAKPAAIAAHKGVQKICASIMTAADCAKHC